MTDEKKPSAGLPRVSLEDLVRAGRRELPVAAARRRDGRAGRHGGVVAVGRELFARLGDDDLGGVGRAQGPCANRTTTPRQEQTISLAGTGGQAAVRRRETADARLGCPVRASTTG